MRKPQSFFELQIIQRDHDLKNHTDIYTLPLFDKLNHYVLHYAKYASRLTFKKSDKETIKELKRTYTDALLITLAAANALNMDLDTEMQERFNKITKNINEYVSNLPKINLNDLRMHSRDVLVIANGAMADTMEKRDHLDDINSKEILIESLSKITQMIIYGCYQLEFDIAETCLKRRAEIQALKIT